MKESDPTWGVTLEKQLQGFEECRIEFLNLTRGYVYLQNQIIVDSVYERRKSAIGQTDLICHITNNVLLVLLN